MCAKRVFKTKTFSRWAKKVVTDAALCIAAREIEAGNYEADLGGGVCKKRVAIPGQGKSTSTRALVAKKSPLAIIFLAGREKSASGSDFSDQEEAAAKILAKGFEKANAEKLESMKESGTLAEICAARNGAKDEEN